MLFCRCNLWIKVLISTFILLMLCPNSASLLKNRTPRRIVFMRQGKQFSETLPTFAVLNKATRKPPKNSATFHNRLRKGPSNNHRKPFLQIDNPVESYLINERFSNIDQLKKALEDRAEQQRLMPPLPYSKTYHYTMATPRPQSHLIYRPTVSIRRPNVPRSYIKPLKNPIVRTNNPQKNLSPVKNPSMPFSAGMDNVAKFIQSIVKSKNSQIVTKSHIIHSVPTEATDAINRKPRLNAIHTIFEFDNNITEPIDHKTFVNISIDTNDEKPEPVILVSRVSEIVTMPTTEIVVTDSMTETVTTSTSSTDEEKSEEVKETKEKTATAEPVTKESTTEKKTTAESTTTESPTEESTTEESTTEESTTEESTTTEITTEATTEATTTETTTTQESTTEENPTEESTTEESTTEKSKTEESTTEESTTEESTTTEITTEATTESTPRPTLGEILRKARKHKKRRKKRKKDKKNDQTEK